MSSTNIDMWQDHGSDFDVNKPPNNYMYGGISFATLFLFTTSRYRDLTISSSNEQVTPNFIIIHILIIFYDTWCLFLRWGWENWKYEIVEKKKIIIYFIIYVVLK